jgi:hypothetical protein
MCPACIGSALAIAAGTTSAGLAALLTFWRVKVKRAAKSEPPAPEEHCSECARG